MTDSKELSVTQKIQSKAAEMLNDLAALLEKNDIPFFLACGTTLGCIRHEGYIPWDDDVDIYIFGTDYPKLREVFAQQDTGNLRLHDGSTVADYPYSFPKVVASDTVLVENGLKHLSYRCGVYIDVFPLIGISDNALVRTLQEKRRYFNYALLRMYYKKYDSTLRKCMGTVVRALISPKRVHESLYRQYIRGCKGSYLIDAGTFGEQALMPQKWFSDAKQMSFESAMLPVPADYEAYLSHYYGDYMQLPPEDQRVSNHDFAVLEFH